MTWTFGRIGVSSPTIFADDFERPDGTLDDNGWIPAGIYPIGSSTENSTRHLQIVSGRATLAVTGAGYAIRRVKGLRKITVSMRWATGSTDTSFVGVVCSNVSPDEGIVDIGVNSVHAVVGRTGRNLNLYNGSISPSVDTDTYTISTGTDVTFSIELTDADEVTITDVDGGTETYASSLIGDLWGDTVYIEVLNTDSATDRIASINSVVLEGDATSVLEGHEPVAWDGDEITLEADLPAQSITDAVALRDAFNGYDLNRDEEVVPITSTEDPSIDGLYRVSSVAVDDRPPTYIEGSLGSRVSIEALKVPGWQAPAVEVTRRGALRVNTNGVSTSMSIHGLPGGFKTPRFTAAPSVEQSVPVENGSVQLFGKTTHTSSVVYGIVPDSFYEGACRVEVSLDGGSTWQLVTGRHVRNLPGFVRIGNGRVRVTASLAGGTTVLRTEVWDSAATPPQWEPCDFNVTDSGSPTTIATYTHSYINGPIGITAGPDGNLWFVGNGNNRIWRVTPGGALKTFTGSGISGPSDICSGPDGNLWFTSPGNRKIGKITPDGVVTMYAAGVVPAYICSDGTDLWFTSTFDSKVGRITTAGTVTTYTDANILGPQGICLGPDGLLWVASNTNDKIVKFTNAATPVFTAYTTGVGNAPNLICSGPDGLLWYTRTDDDAICKITTSGSVTTYTASVPNAPNDICSDGTDLWFTYQDGIGKITTAGSVTPNTKATIDNPQGIVKGPDNNLWFTSYDNNRVGVLNPAAGGGPVELGGTLTILRNAPETVGIRLGAADGPELLDLSLRRGMNFLEGYLQSTTSSTYGFFRTESETGANVGSYGVEANTANAYGNKYYIVSPQDITQDTTGVSGIVLAAGATTFAFAFSPENAETVIGSGIDDAYFAADEERQKVVTR